MRPLEDFITPTQKGLYNKLRKIYAGKALACKNSYVLVRGEAPIMLVAHLDTVHKEPVREICKTNNGNILMSPQGIGGDDRCGVYALCAVYEQAPVKPWLLFTCDEEVGGVGAEQFCTKHKLGKLPPEVDGMKLLVEIDRKGKDDAVYYDCGNDEFEEYITSKGFKTQWGSFSDISYIAPELGVAAVNLSSGYYNAHTQHEYINRKHLNATVQKVLSIVADAAKPEFPKYEYVESVSFGYGGGWGKYDYWGGWGKTTISTTKKSSSVETDEDKFLKQIPEEIREEYAALLDFYSMSELEKLRGENGDWVIIEMFETEFGSWECYYGCESLDDFEDDVPPRSAVK